MADDMDRIDAGAPVQIVGNLLQPILAAIQYDDLATFADAGDELCRVLHVAVDEDDLLALIAAGGWRGSGTVIDLAVAGTVRLGRGVGLDRIGNRGGNRPVEHHARFEGQ